MMVKVSGVSKGLRKSAAWSVVDQGISSIGSFLLSVLVARTANLTEFGAFAVVMVVYSLVITGSRAFISMPFMMRAATAQSSTELRTESVGAAAIIAVPTALLLAIAAPFTSPDLAKYLIIFAATTPFLVVQDAYRFVLRQEDRSSSVALNDAVWTLSQIVLSIGVALSPGAGMGLWYFIAWDIAVGIAAIHGAWASRILPSMTAGRRFLVTTKPLAVPLLIEAFAISGSGAAAQFTITSVGGLSALGPIKAANVVLGPVNVIAGGLLFLVTPIILQTGSADRSRLHARCLAFASTTAVVGIGAGVVALVLPDSVGSALLGDSWAAATPVIVPSVLAMIAYGSQTAAMLGFRAHQIAKRTMRLRLISFPIPVVSGIAGLHFGGPVGAAYGLFVGAAALSLVLWTALLRTPQTKSEI